MSYPIEEGGFLDGHERFSTTDLVEILGRSSREQMDLETATGMSKDLLVEKATEMKVSDLWVIGARLQRQIPELDTLFGQAFGTILAQITPDEGINGTHLFEAYARAVYNVRGRTSRNLSHGMFNPGVIGAMFDHFDVPIKESVIAKVQNPELAQQYRARTKRWVTGPRA